ncbi:MAG: hypothetical protein WB681_13195 [Candidatus Cybelea sp.]
MKNERSEIVFVVRMWQQGIGEDGGSEWRGSIHQVDSGRSFYVTGPREVADFISVSLVEEASSTRQVNPAMRAHARRTAP